MQSSANTFVLHCSTPVRAEELRHSGLTFRNKPATLRFASNVQWVKLTFVVYGTTEGAVKLKLHDFGTVLQILEEKIHDVTISVCSVKLDITVKNLSRLESLSDMIR